MLIESIGVDIEDIKRFSQKKFESNIPFYQRIFSEEEIDYCLKKIDPYPHFTARFCAKEAAIKALKNESVGLDKIEIVIKDNKPLLKMPNGKECLVSLSHTNEYAVALVILVT